MVLKFGLIAFTQVHIIIIDINKNEMCVCLITLLNTIKTVYNDNNVSCFCARCITCTVYTVYALGAGLGARLTYYYIIIYVGNTLASNKHVVISILSKTIIRSECLFRFVWFVCRNAKRHASQRFRAAAAFGE